MTEMSDIKPFSDHLEQSEDKDTEEGEILEDGEIGEDEEDCPLSEGALKGEEKENSRQKDVNSKERDGRRHDSDNSKDRKSEDRVKERDRRERERERRHVYDRSSRERKTSEDRDRDRDRKTSVGEDERRRRERERKRRRSDEEDRDDKRKRNTRDQNWSEFNNDSNNNRNNNFEDFERQRFEDMDFRQPDVHFGPNAGPIQHSSDEDDMNVDDRDFEEMMQIMDNMPSTRIRSMDGTEKRAMMKAMAHLMKRNLDSDKGRRLARLRDRRRASDRTPGPTGTRAIRAQNERQERPQGFKQICKFFLDGKCHKGNDCTYSHEALPFKKKDLCKFYLQGFCGKGEECLFMHSEFPCKFFHTNVECYSGANCRFSHQPLTEETREILRNYLDSGQLPDDPKPDRLKPNDTKCDIKSENSFKSQSNDESIKPSSSPTPSAGQSSSATYAPLKPVAKRHALLGEATHDMKTSHYTWLWQLEMKELEVAYVGNKRNLFCIEKPFVMEQKPPTPRMEDDEDEIEEQIRNYYRDTMPEFGSEDQDLRTIATIGSPLDTKPMASSLSDEQKLIEASAHDEDLRTLMMRPRSQTNEANNNDVKANNCEQMGDERERERSQVLMGSEESQSKAPLAEVPHNLPKVARDLYIRMQNKMLNESESKTSDLLSDSDDDDKEVLSAALKNVNATKDSANDSKHNISQMLSAIRNSTNSSTVTQSPKGTDFWHNLLSGIQMPGAGGSPQTNSAAIRGEYRDPRLKRGKDSMSPLLDTTPAVKICDPNVKIEYKLWPMKAPEIDYNTYVSLYRIDTRLKNDPRLQRYFSKVSNTEMESMSRVVPPPLKTAPVTPLCVLKSIKRSEKERKEKIDKECAETLPPLPPLTISPSKPLSTPGIFPPTPPPIMSPLELISSKHNFD